MPRRIRNSRRRILETALQVLQMFHDRFPRIECLRSAAAAGEGVEALFDLFGQADGKHCYTSIATMEGRLSEVDPKGWTVFRAFLSGAAGLNRGGFDAAFHSGPD